MEHEFPFKTYRPEKQDYFFIFSIALANDLKRPVPLTFQPDLPEAFWRR